MTETSGENTAWIYPTTGFPNRGGWSIALKIHQALTTGRQTVLFLACRRRNREQD